VEGKGKEKEGREGKGRGQASSQIFWPVLQSSVKFVRRQKTYDIAFLLIVSNSK